MEWTLTLEKQGVRGNGMIFDKKETSAAKSIPQQVNNYYGTVVNGNVDKSQLTTGNENIISLQTDISDSSGVSLIRKISPSDRYPGSEWPSICGSRRPERRWRR